MNFGIFLQMTSLIKITENCKKINGYERREIQVKYFHTYHFRHLRFKHTKL